MLAPGRSPGPFQTPSPRSPMRFLRPLVPLGALLLAALPLVRPTSRAATGLGNVIFIHPDGASSATWAAVRALQVGPDGDLNWDRLPAIAVYRGHMADSLVATSNGGATTHATGRKVASDAFGRSAGGEAGRDLVDDAGRALSVGHQALRAGLPVGLVQTGIAPEPGSACFLVEAPSRYEYDAIACPSSTVTISPAETILPPSSRNGITSRSSPWAEIETIMTVPCAR